MKLAYTPEQEAFRQQVREFVATELPADIRTKVERGLRLEHADYVTWFNLLESRGWLTPSWPASRSRSSSWWAPCTCPA